MDFGLPSVGGHHQAHVQGSGNFQQIELDGVISFSTLIGHPLIPLDYALALLQGRLDCLGDEVDSSLVHLFKVLYNRDL